MVLPKGGGTKTAKKTAPTKKKTTTAKKTSKTAKTSPKGTKSGDAALKARLKKLLENEYAATSSKSKTSSASGNCNPSESSNIRDLFTSEVQQFIIKAAKKEGLTKSKSKKDDDFFKKQDKNKTAAAAKKATAKKSTTKKTVTISTAAGSNCPDGTCPFVKKKTAAKKATATAKTPTGTKRKVVATKTDAKKPRTVAAKKTAVKKSSACGPCGANCGCSSSDDCATGRCGVKSRGRGGGCCDDDDDDDDDDDSSSYDDSDWTDSDSSDDGGCGGGGCGPPPRRGGGGGGRDRGRVKPKDSSSSSGDCPDGKCPFVRRRDVWNCENIEQPPKDNGNADNDAEKSVVPYVQNGHTSTDDDDDDYSLFEDLLGEFAADSFSDYSGEEEGSEEHDNSLSSLDDSSFDDSDEEDDSDDEEYSFEDDSDDDEYQLPDDENEDLFIRRGEAKIYEVNSSEIQFDSDNSTAQIFEIPTSDKNLDKNNEKNDDSDDSCPQLVPIDFAASNGASVDTDDYYSFSEDDDSSDGSQEERDPPNMKPAIFAADNSLLDDSFPQNFSMLQSSFECYENGNDVSMEYVSPLQRIKSSATTPAKYKVVTVGKPKSNGSPLRSPKLTSTVELDQSQTEDVQPNDSKFYNSLNSYQVLLLLKKTIYFHGILKVKLIAGGVNIFGYNMTTDETIETFSPRGNNLLYVAPQPHSIQLSKNHLKKKLETFTKDFMTADINDLLQNYDQQHDAIVLLERNDRDKRIDMIRKHMKEIIFPNSLNVSSPQYHSEVLLRSRFHSRCYNSLRISPKWDSIDVTPGTKMLVIGGKGVGKSTFIRYMINKNLVKFKQFVLIDLDIGQPEIFLPQTISVTLISRPILGPGYFYGLTPTKAYLFGDINVILSPLSYITNVKQLLQYCRDETNFKNIPWIVNTMGYNKGFGSELLSVIINNLRPTDIVQLQSSKQYNNFDFQMSPENVRSITRNIYTEEPRCNDIAYNLFVIDSAVPVKRSTSHGEWDMTPKDIRFCMIIAMLGSLLSERDEWLTDVKPYCVPIDELNIICFGDDSVTKTELLEVVNGNMVYLCDNSSPTIECHGIGIVRGIDMFQRKLYILPSVSQQSLAKVNTIAVCNIPLPTSILLNQGPKIKGLVPYTYNTDDFMSSKHVPSHIYRPQHFLQGSRKRILNE